MISAMINMETQISLDILILSPWDKYSVMRLQDHMVTLLIDLGGTDIHYAFYTSSTKLHLQQIVILAIFHSL